MQRTKNQDNHKAHEGTRSKAQGARNSGAVFSGNQCSLRLRFFRLTLGVVFLSGAAFCAEPYAVRFERNVAVKMRDGVTLRADIYRPTADGKFPVLLQRTPYDKNGGVDLGLKGAARGFVVIFQDVRGRYASEGEWYTFKNEPNDGYDTIEWAAALPYSDGKVGMFGGSYVGATQMLAAITHPPHLAGICPVVTASNYHSNWTYQGGAFEQWFNESWTSGLAQDTFAHTVGKSTNATIGMWKLPLTSYPLFNLQHDPGATAALAPYFLDWLDHPSYDDYWKRISIEEHFGDIAVPALHTAAWYDIFLGGSLRNYEGIKAHGATEEARRGQKLLVIVGGHAGNGPKIGEVDFGAESNFDEGETILRWYEYLFKGAKNEFASDKPVRIFVMGENKYREEDDWPLARAKESRYFLHSGGKANAVRGNGTLSAAAPGNENPDQYIYDPAKPVPTVGGPLCCDGQHGPGGEEDPGEVDVEHPPPLGQGGLVHQPRTRHAGVGVEDVDAAEAGDRLADRRLDRGLVGDVGDEPQAADRDLRRAQVDERNLRPFGGEALSRRAPEAGRGPGHERDLPGEPHGNAKPPWTPRLTNAVQVSAMLSGVSLEPAWNQRYGQMTVANTQLASIPASTDASARPASCASRIRSRMKRSWRLRQATTARRRSSLRRSSSW